MMEHEAIGRVRRGAGFLDREHPGWAAKVPADKRLRVALVDHCVLAWAYGEAALGVAALRDAMRRATPPGGHPGVHLGFMAGEDSYANLSHAYRLLTRAWRAAIRARGGGLPRSTEGSECSS